MFVFFSRFSYQRHNNVNFVFIRDKIRLSSQLTYGNDFECKYLSKILYFITKFPFFLLLTSQLILVENTLLLLVLRIERLLKFSRER